MKTFLQIFAMSMTFILCVMTYQILSENPEPNYNWLGGLIMWGFYFAVFVSILRRK